MANKRKRRAARRKPIIQSEKYSIRALHEDREYGMYWYAWLWKLVRPVLSVSLAREKVFFDGRAAMLLQLIDETKSVRLACQRMQMSYSSGWNVIRRLESQLSRMLIRRSQGGAGGGMSSLTEDGKLLLERFEAYSEALREQAGALFDQYFEGLFG